MTVIVRSRHLKGHRQFVEAFRNFVRQEGMEDTLRVYREELGLKPLANPRATLLALERRKRFVLQLGTGPVRA